MDRGPELQHQFVQDTATLLTGLLPEGRGTGSERELQKDTSWNTYLLFNTVQMHINSQYPATPRVRNGYDFTCTVRKLRQRWENESCLLAPSPASLTTVYRSHRDCAESLRLPLLLRSCQRRRQKGFCPTEVMHTWLLSDPMYFPS